MLTGEQLLWRAAIVGVILIAFFVLFRQARKPTCTWPRWWRLTAQIPGWFLVAFGAGVIVLKAREEIQQHTIGIGTGTVAAVIGATVKGIAKAAGRDDDDQG